MRDLKPDEVFDSKYHRVNRNLLKLIGLWPYQTRTLKFFIRVMVVVSIYGLVVPQLIKSVLEWTSDDRDVEILVENFAGFMYCHGIMSKLLSCAVFEKELTTLYQQISKDWIEITDVEERAVLHRHASIGYLLTVLYVGYCYVACVCFVWSPIVIPAALDIILPTNESHKKSLCYYGEYFIDQQEYLYYLVVQTFISVSCTIIVVTGVDTTYVCVAYHALGLFKIIDYRMNKSFEYVQNKFRTDTKFCDDELHNYVVESIKLHNKAIEFTNFLQSSFTNCFFFVTFLVLLCLSVGTMDLLWNLDNPSNLFRIGFVWIGIIFYLFYVNWPGQCIMDHSLDIFASAYSCGWYRFPLKTQFLIKFMMMRSTKPCQLTAGPLLVMNFENCGAILKTAMSYFTVVASFS